MGKINMKRPNKKIEVGKGVDLSNQVNDLCFWIKYGLDTVNDLSKIYNTISSTIDGRKAMEVDHLVKFSKAETELAKEKNRHEERMAVIEQEQIKISELTVDRERRLSYIEDEIRYFTAEYEKYIGLSTEEFLTPEVTRRLEDLRKAIIEITKVLNKTI